ncbi:hypothetical protein GCM10012284_08170 [Mangrovihabitans endophyticus]|uniref:Uncharacterized protein n=1 Tax=Mangrovihabitans endophyticus TaxID=1751298 RepID=A0A8J3BWL0_9ACTN|nr:hypothetical protein GCM10012284_08170 [Mangrovihabitans endophyticus]
MVTSRSHRSCAAGNAVPASGGNGGGAALAGTDGTPAIADNVEFPVAMSRPLFSDRLRQVRI